MLNVLNRRTCYGLIRKLQVISGFEADRILSLDSGLESHLKPQTIANCLAANMVSIQSILSIVSEKLLSQS